LAGHAVSINGRTQFHKQGGNLSNAGLSIPPIIAKMALETASGSDQTASGNCLRPRTINRNALKAQQHDSPGQRPWGLPQQTKCPERAKQQQAQNAIRVSLIIVPGVTKNELGSG
jgi:hypothetical protein